MNLDDLLKEMKEKMQKKDLSDEYLGKNGNTTRTEIGIGEYSYGITTIPCEWVYDFLSDYKRVLKENESLQKTYDDCYCKYKHYKQFESISVHKVKDVIEKEIKYHEKNILDITTLKGKTTKEEAEIEFNKYVIVVLKKMLQELLEGRKI